MTSTAPATSLVAAEHVRVAREDFTLWADVSFQLSGKRVGLLGDWSPLFRVVGRQAQLLHGELWLDAEAAERVLQRGSAALIEHQPTLPRSYSCLEYLSASAYLGGLDLSAKDLARRLQALSFDWLAARRIGTLSAAETRALSLAQATLPEVPPRTFLLETPLLDLAAAEQDWLLQVLDRLVTNEQNLIVSLPGNPKTLAERRLFESCDAVYRLSSGVVTRVDRQQLDGKGRHRLALAERGSEFRAALEAAGLTTESAPGTPRDLEAAAATPTAEEPFVVLLDTPERTGLIFELSVKLAIPVLHLTRFEDDSP